MWQQVDVCGREQGDPAVVMVVVVPVEEWSAEAASVVDVLKLSRKATVVL